MHGAFNVAEMLRELFAEAIFFFFSESKTLFGFSAAQILDIDTGLFFAIDQWSMDLDLIDASDSVGFGVAMSGSIQCLLLVSVPLLEGGLLHEGTLLLITEVARLFANV